MVTAFAAPCILQHFKDFYLTNQHKWHHLPSIPYDTCSRMILWCWCSWRQHDSCVFQMHTRRYLEVNYCSIQLILNFILFPEIPEGVKNKHHLRTFSRFHSNHPGSCSCRILWCLCSWRHRGTHEPDVDVQLIIQMARIRWHLCKDNFQGTKNKYIWNQLTFRKIYLMVLPTHKTPSPEYPVQHVQ